MIDNDAFFIVIATAVKALVWLKKKKKNNNNNNNNKTVFCLVAGLLSQRDAFG